MKLFWNTNKQKKSFWGEYHFKNSKSWIFFLLKNVQYNIIENLNELEGNDSLIIIDSELNSKESFYLNVSKKCSNIYLIHLGDEGSTEKKDLIYSLCTHVWRTFGSILHFKNKNITCIPIGYKSGILPNEQAIDKRKYTWSFIGTTHGSSRFDLQYQNKDLEPHYIKLTSKFASQDSLSVSDYYEILNNTIFSLIPHGYFHPETYRFYESLESGCIPIIENPHGYFDIFYPNNPFFKIQLWKEANFLMKEMINDKKKLTEKSNNIIIWWKKYKREIQVNFEKKINGR